MRLAIGLVCAVGSTAAAEPSPQLVDLTMQARAFARNHDCGAIAPLGAHVREVDPAYYRDVFSTDPRIRDCDVVRLGDGAKDPATAMKLSVGVTLGSAAASGPLIVAGAVGLLVGPSAGHIYTGDVANRWLAVELGGLGGGLVGTVMLAAYAISNIDASPGSHDDAVGIAGAVLMVGGALTFVVGAGGNLGSAGASAEAYNREHHLEVRIAPMAVASTSGIAPGVGLGGRF